MSERQQAQPDPAVQVAPVEDTQSGRFDKQTDQRALGLRQPIEPPQSSLEKALESVNNSLKAWSTGIRFDMDEDAQRLVVSIVDSASGEVLRTIPSEAVLRVAKMIVQLQGSGVDTKA
jgi:flagellar protein FlaG